MLTKLLKYGGKAAQAAGKATAKGAKKAGKATGKAAKNAAKKRAKAFKNKLKKMTGASLIGSIGGMIGSLFNSDGETQSAGNQSTGEQTPQRQPGQPIPQSDPLINFDGLTAAIAAAIPSLEGLDKSSNRSDANLTSLIIRENIELPVSIDGQEDPEIKATIPAGQFIASRILELGTLWQVVDHLKDQVGMLAVDLTETNDNLKLIAKKVGVAITENQRTKRENERRRDEADAEGGDDKQGFVAGKIEEVKEMAKTGLLGMGALLATGLGFVGMMTAGAFAVEAAEEGFGDDEEEVVEETPIIEEDPSILDTALGSLDSGVGGALDTVATGATIASLGGMAASAMGVAGGAAVTAVAAPIAAVAGAGALGYAAGTVLYEHTGLKEGISSMIDSHLAGESLDVGAGSSPAAMKEKYGNKKGAELLGDLLGEGYLDLAEDPNDITAFFRDNVKNMEDYNDLNSDYLEEYDRPITSALNDVLGIKGVESIFDIITANAIENVKEEKVREVNGIKVRPVNTPRPTELRGAEIPSSTSAPITPDVEIRDKDLIINDILQAQQEEDENRAIYEEFMKDKTMVQTGSYNDWGELEMGLADPELEAERQKLEKNFSDPMYKKEDFNRELERSYAGLDASYASDSLEDLEEDVQKVQALRTVFGVDIDRYRTNADTNYIEFDNKRYQLGLVNLYDKLAKEKRAEDVAAGPSKIVPKEDVTPEPQIVVDDTTENTGPLFDITPISNAISSTVDRSIETVKSKGSSVLSNISDKIKQSPIGGIIDSIFGPSQFEKDSMSIEAENAYVDKKLAIMDAYNADHETNTNKRREELREQAKEEGRSPRIQFEAERLNMGNWAGGMFQFGGPNEWATAEEIGEGNPIPGMPGWTIQGGYPAKGDLAFNETDTEIHQQYKFVSPDTVDQGNAVSNVSMQAAREDRLRIRNFGEETIQKIGSSIGNELFGGGLSEIDITSINGIKDAARNIGDIDIRDMGDVVEKARSAIIPIMIPAAEKVMKGPVSGNSAKQFIGSALSSFNTADSFLEPTLFT